MKREHGSARGALRIIKKIHLLMIVMRSAGCARLIVFHNTPNETFGPTTIYPSDPDSVYWRNVILLCEHSKVTIIKNVNKRPVVIFIYNHFINDCKKSQAGKSPKKHSEWRTEITLVTMGGIRLGATLSPATVTHGRMPTPRHSPLLPVPQTETALRTTWFPTELAPEPIGGPIPQHDPRSHTQRFWLTGMSVQDDLPETI
jgi:hypothetical protein